MSGNGVLRQAPVPGRVLRWYEWLLHCNTLALVAARLHRDPPAATTAANATVDGLRPSQLTGPVASWVVRQATDQLAASGDRLNGTQVAGTSRLPPQRLWQVAGWAAVAHHVVADHELPMTDPVTDSATAGGEAAA